MVAAVATTELVGRVARVNERGILLRDHDTWANVSKYANVTMPEVGQFVRLTLDRSGFVREVAVDGEPAPASAVPASSQPADRDTFSMRPDRLQARTAALQAATRIVGRPTSVGEVLATAEQITSWLLR